MDIQHSPSNQTAPDNPKIKVMAEKEPGGAEDTEAEDTEAEDTEAEDTEAVQLQLEPPVARLTLANPSRRNALSTDVMSSLTRQLRQLAQTDQVRAIVIQAQGPAFSAGHDISEMSHRSQDFYRQLFQQCCDLMASVRAAPQPVIAQVDGIATAAGCQLVAACDLAVASQNSTFATPGVKIGLFCSTPMVPVSRAVGRKRAMEMLLTAEPISAEQAADWGLINRVVPATELEAAVRQLVEQICRHPFDVVALGKQAFYDQLDLSERQAYELAADVMVDNALLDNAQEGFEAFLGKRPPEWK